MNLGKEATATATATATANNYPNIKKIDETN